MTRTEEWLQREQRAAIARVAGLGGPVLGFSTYGPTFVPRIPSLPSITQAAAYKQNADGTFPAMDGWS